MYEKYCKLRDSKGVNDSDVAKATGITKSTFSDWKNGRSEPKPPKLLKIANYFGVPVDYLLSEKTDTKTDGVLIYVQPSWYTDHDTAELAQRLFDDPAYRVLFDAAADATPEDLQTAADILRRLKEARRK